MAAQPSPNRVAVILGFPNISTNTILRNTYVMNLYNVVLIYVLSTMITMNSTVKMAVYMMLGSSMLAKNVIYIFIMRTVAIKCLLVIPNVLLDEEYSLKKGGNHEITSI